MNEISMQNNRRLLEVIELLDSKYIEEMFDDLKVPQRQEEPKITWRAPFKHWKRLAALAACILLLSLVIPLFGYVGNLIADFAAGAGTAEDSTEVSTETANKYDEDIPDGLKVQTARIPGSVELTTDEMRRIVWAFIKNRNPLEEELKRTYSIACYAKSGGAYAVMITVSEMFYADSMYREIVNDIEFVYSNSNRLKIYKDGEIYSINSAFEKGLIDEEYLLSIDWYKRAAFSYLQTSYPVPLESFEIMDILEVYAEANYTAGIKGLDFSVRCYGVFHSSEKHAYVIMIDRTDYSYKDQPSHEKVNGLVFEYPTEQRMLVFNWEGTKFYSLGEAFESGLLTAEELQEVYDTYTHTGDPDSDLPTGIRVWDWYHPDDSERYPYFSVSLPEFNNVTIERDPKDGNIYVDGVHLLGGVGYGCSSFYLSDLTGDGYPELCFVMNFGSGIVDHRIEIIDYTTKETVFTAIGRMYRDYYLFLRNGVLCVKETEYAKQEPIRTGVLKHNGSEITIIWDSEVNATVDRDPVPNPGEPVS